MAYSEKQIEDTFFKIIDRIESGESLRAILRDKNMPSSRTFYGWIDSSEIKLKRYARATRLRAEIIFDEIIEIADNTQKGIEIVTKSIAGKEFKEVKESDMLGHRRLQIDSRKWILSKMNPEKYGEKLDMTSGNEKIKTTIIVQDNNTKDELDKMIDEND